MVFIGKKKPIYKWTCIVQTFVIQGSTVLNKIKQLNMNHLKRLHIISYLTEI